MCVWRVGIESGEAVESAPVFRKRAHNSGHSHTVPERWRGWKCSPVGVDNTWRAIRLASGQMRPGHKARPT